MSKLVLASASPRRKELMKQAGLACSVRPSEVEEVMAGDDPAQVVMELSLQKAMDVRSRAAEDEIVIGADTVVAVDGRILGKPADTQDAFSILSMLQGRKHQVYTGVTICGPQKTVSFSERTDVEVRPMTEQEILDYIRTGEPMDKAGAYGIQGRFAVYVKGITGDYNNVIGLPLSRLCQELARLGALS